MIVYYYGADSPWSTQTEGDINRRNMAVLLTLAEQPKVEAVYNIIRCTRALILNKTKQTCSQHPKIKNLYIAPILPEKGLLKRLTNPINRRVLKWLYKKDINNNTQAISWCYWPNALEDYLLFRITTKIVFDTDHNIIDDPNLHNSQRKRREELLLLAGRIATIIISSSRSMLHWFEERGVQNTALMLNGVFESRINLKNQIPSEQVNITYCGMLSRWLKLDWLLNLIKDHPKWHFNIIGKNYKTDVENQLAAYSNVELHGFLKPTKALKYIKQSTVCIGLYNEHPALDVNSMKLYDYLSQAKSVVLNDYHKYLNEDFNKLVYTAKTYEEFNNAILRLCNKPSNKQAYASFLENVIWTKRVSEILNLLE